MKKNNYAFIDSQNLNLGVKSQGWTLDFKRFRIFIKEKYNIEKAFLFIGFVSDNQHLYAELQKSGYICIFKPTLRIKKGRKIKIKSNVDAELVLYSMIEYYNYKKSLIVSGDGDFYCLVDYLAKKNKLLKVIVPNARYSSLLKKYSRYISNIQLFKEKLERK